MFPDWMFLIQPQGFPRRPPPPGKSQGALFQKHGQQADGSVSRGTNKSSLAHVPLTLCCPDTGALALSRAAAPSVLPMAGRGQATGSWAKGVEGEEGAAAPGAPV